MERLQALTNKNINPATFLKPLGCQHCYVHDVGRFSGDMG